MQGLEMNIPLQAFFSRISTFIAVAYNRRRCSEPYQPQGHRFQYTAVVDALRFIIADDHVILAVAFLPQYLRKLACFVAQA
jgi:hypothetical protein